MAVSLKKLSELSGVSGCEDEVRRYIISEIEANADRVEVDSMGNIIAFKRGKSDERRILIGTNTDEAGFIVSEITDKGYLKFKPVGFIDPRTVVSKCVVIGSENVKGVIGMKAVHLQKKSERENAVNIEDLYIDIGAGSKKKAQKRVNLGDYITFDTAFSEAGDSMKGKALGRFGTVCAAESMSEIPAYDTYFVFSAQSEIPCSVPGRGMRIAAYRIKPDYAVIINASEADDVYLAKAPALRLGGGAAVGYMDKTSISDARFTAAIEAFASRRGIGIQRKMSSAGSSITGAVQTASNATTAACISIPCRYLHSPVSVMNKNDINAVTALCAAVVKESDVIINEIAENID